MVQQFVLDVTRRSDDVHFQLQLLANFSDEPAQQSVSGENCNGADETAMQQKHQFK